MNRRGRLDAVVVGGGVVGAACALALSRRGLDVALVEASEPASWPSATPDLRVYAIAPDSAALLDGLDAWDGIAPHAGEYRRMCVWDAHGGGDLAFDADRMGRTGLGWIVEHALLVDRLWTGLRRSGVRIACPGRVEALSQDADGVELRLTDGTRLAARIAIAADGAGSSLRQLAGVDVTHVDYGQRGVVAYVDTEHAHAATAWQRFLPTGPLAFLPCRDGASSIVWTLPEEEARRVLDLGDDAFSDEVTEASGGRLGRVTPRSARVGFPLHRQLASTALAGRVALVGDAAHVVHPLAGQGVNLGLRDVAALASLVDDALARRIEWSTPHRLARWARTRQSENAVAAHAFGAINAAFSNDGMAATLLRGPLLGLAGRIPPLSRLLWRHAAGQ